MLDRKNYYEVLEVPIGANMDDIKLAYQRAKNTYSKDGLALYSLIGPDESEQILSLIEEAYGILSDLEKRKNYDQARGIACINYHATNSSTPAFDGNLALNTKVEAHDHSVARKVATKRFQLDYVRNEDFEKEIEQTSDFTGAYLKKIREYKNAEIPWLSDITKISKSYLRAIESEEYHGLPAPVYVRGFVYQYAKGLRLNPDLVANSYLYRMKKALEA